MLRTSPRTFTFVLFALFVVAGAIALAASTIIMGTLIVAASEGASTPFAVICGGALVGVLAAMIVHEIGMVAPRVARELGRRRGF